MTNSANHQRAELIDFHKIDGNIALPMGDREINRTAHAIKAMAHPLRLQLLCILGTMQRLADLLDTPVDRPIVQETTALGAAYLAGMQTGFYPPFESFEKSWSLDKRFTPAMPASERERKYEGWKDAVRRTLSS